jgi:hypothetical protein
MPMVRWGGKEKYQFMITVVVSIKANLQLEEHALAYFQKMYMASCNAGPDEEHIIIEYRVFPKR